MSPSTPALAAPLALFARQGIVGEAEGVKDTFSSWDSCMAKSYCKYPVIIAIVVGSLIALSIIFCIVRCCCCGLECCCGICSCFNACCPSPRGGRSRTKYKDPERPPFQPSSYQGYQPTPAPFYNSQPQYAQFETGRGKKGGEDALPAMPSWDHAAERRVENEAHHEEMEMGRIDPDHEQKAPMLANQQPAPYGGQGPYGGHGDTMPYQQHIAREGGDLGVASYGPSPTYRGAQTTGTVPVGGAAFAGAAAGAGAAGRGTPTYGDRNIQQQRPALEPGYSSYSVSPPSSAYTAPQAQSHELHGVSPPPPGQQTYGVTPYQQSNSSIPSALSAGPGQQQGFLGQQNYQAYQPARKPVEGSWRDV